LGPIPSGGTETGISVVAPCQCTESYWGEPAWYFWR